MSKILEKSWKTLQREITWKQLVEWVTASQHKYKTSIFSRTWWNIILFHTFFVLVVVIVFGITLYQTKLIVFKTLGDVLTLVLAGKYVDPTIISDTAKDLDRIGISILLGVLVFSIITGLLAAHITLGPTRKAFAQQKRFIGTIAHELRTPLAVLRTQNEVALYDVDEESPIHEVIKENINQTKHLTSILNNLLIFNRIDTSESIQFGLTNVEPIVRSVIQRLEKLADKKRVILTIKPVGVPDIMANETALEQAIYNIIKNSIIYSKPSGGNVLVKINHEDGEWVTIKIKDEGIGIPKQMLPHIFEPFYRVSDYGSSTQKGSGLGLALVYEVIKLHSGTISVSSSQNDGTTFTLKFPMKVNTSNSTESQSSDIEFNFKS